MKITLEDANTDEIEIIIKGNLADENVSHLIKILKSSKVTSKIILQDEAREMLVDINDIFYFEVINRKTYARTVEGEFLCKNSLTELISLFSNQGVVQISKSLLVNINYVKSLESEFSGNYVITLEKGIKLIVSRLFMKNFRKAIMEL